MEAELTEFCSSAINNVVNNRFTLQWTQDNKISVIQKENIDIFNFRPKLTQIVSKTSFERCVLTISQEYPIEKTGIDVNSFLYRLDRTSVYNMFLDPLLAPRAELCRPISPEFVYAIWSQAGLLSNNQCVLLTLTNLGSAQIHVHKNNSMITIGNINDFWLEEVKKYWGPTVTGTIMPLYEQHKQRAYQLHITAISWSSHHGSYCYLATGHNNGEVGIWKIINIDIRAPKFIPEFIIRFSASDNTVSAIHWHTVNHKIFIFTGHVNGNIEGFYIDPQNKTVDVDKKIDIWSDNDKIKINLMKVLELSKNFVLLAVKGLFIVATLMDQKGKVLCTETATVASYYITGIQHIEGSEFMVCTISGEITNFKIIVNDEESRIELEQSEISNQLDFEHFGSFGVACSKSKALWAFILSPVKVYDHLIMKQPTSLKFCTWKRFNPIDLLKTNPGQKLTDYWECLDYMRQKVLQDKMLPEWPVCTRENNSAYEIKILFWLATELNQVIKRQAKPVDFDASIIKDLSDQINIRHIINLFDKLYPKYKKSPKKLPKLESRIIRNCRDFLKQYTDKENEEVLGKTLFNEVVRCHKEATKIKVRAPAEKCSWCMENLTELKCPNSHNPSTCMISLLPVSNLDYLVCSICERIAHIELIDQSPLCTYCDVPLIRQTFERKNEAKTEVIEIIEQVDDG